MHTFDVQYGAHQVLLAVQPHFHGDFRAAAGHGFAPELPLLHAPAKQLGDLLTNIEKMREYFNKEFPNE